MKKLTQRGVGFIGFLPEKPGIFIFSQFLMPLPQDHFLVRQVFIIVPGKEIEYLTNQIFCHNNLPSL
jgi:hypothetical protein